MNNRTATLYAGIDPETKARAESILAGLAAAEFVKK